MKHFKIKVCGITRLNDALLACEQGADMLGFVFHKASPRFMTSAKTKKILSKLPATVDRVGVFVEPEPNAVLSAARNLNLDYVQIHGKLAPTLIRELHNNGTKIIHSFHVQSLNSYREIKRSRAELIHLDNRSQERYGGTGRQFDWRLKPPKTIPNLVLAGGINVKNVKKGLAIFKPLVVDVNSGVESRPGIKSALKLKQFFKFCNHLRYGTKA